MPNPDDLERIYKENSSQLTPEQKENAEKTKKKLAETEEKLTEILPTAKDFNEKRFQRDLAIYRLGIRADEMNIISKLEDIRQALIERDLEYANMVLYYLIVGLRK